MICYKTHYPNIPMPCLVYDKNHPKIFEMYWQLQYLSCFLIEQVFAVNIKITRQDFDALVLFAYSLHVPKINTQNIISIKWVYLALFKLFSDRFLEFISQFLALRIPNSCPSMSTSISQVLISSYQRTFKPLMQVHADIHHGMDY